MSQRLFVVTYGATSTSDQVFSEYVALHKIDNDDLLIIVAGFDGDMSQLHAERQKLVSLLARKARTVGVALRFVHGGNAILLYTDVHDLERIYSCVYAQVHELIHDPRYRDSSHICTYGDGHPQIMMATVTACMQFSSFTLMFMYAHSTHMATASFTAPRSISGNPIILPQRMRFSYKHAVNLYHDLHVFIDQINIVLSIPDYDSAYWMIYSKYLHADMPEYISNIVVHQWQPVIEGMRAWHNFNHGEAWTMFHKLLKTYKELLPQVKDSDEAQSLTRVIHTIETLIIPKLENIMVQNDALRRLAETNEKNTLTRSEVIQQHINDLYAYNKSHNLHGYEVAIDKYVNALRAIDQARYDDASVRLNSVLEDLARMRLLLRWGIVIDKMRKSEAEFLLYGTKNTLSNDPFTNVSRKDLYNMIGKKDENDLLYVKYTQIGGGGPYHQNPILEEAILRRHKSYLVHGNQVLERNECMQFADLVGQLMDAAVGNPVNLDPYQMPHISFMVNFYPNGASLRELGLQFMQ